MQDIFKSLFRYNDDGTLTHASMRPGVTFGSVAGHKAAADGYTRISVAGQKFLAHHIVWCMHHGDLPKEIDHINGDKSDNRIENLRLATRAQNAANFHKLRATNTSGMRGVTWDAAKSSWKAQIGYQGKHKFLGYFDTQRDAGVCYNTVARILFGDFSNAPEPATESTP